uniref:Uncharacterized protein n=1 Tax=Macrostomum lignano TaxID=282301 RepID=A0A1I8HLK1_9PLAT
MCLEPSPSLKRHPLVCV